MIIACVLIVVQTSLVYLFAKSKTWDWFNSLAATLISVLLGIFTGFLLFQHQTKEISIRDKKNMNVIIQQELLNLKYALNDEKLSKVFFQDGTVVDFIVPYSQPIALERAAQSGLYDDPPEETAILLILAEKIRSFNQIASIVANNVYSRSTLDKRSIKAAARTLEEKRNTILHDMDFVADQLKIDMSVRKIGTATIK